MNMFQVPCTFKHGPRYMLYMYILFLDIYKRVSKDLQDLLETSVAWYIWKCYDSAPSTNSTFCDLIVLTNLLLEYTVLFEAVLRVCCISSSVQTNQDGREIILFPKLKRTFWPPFNIPAPSKVFLLSVASNVQTEQRRKMFSQFVQFEAWSCLYNPAALRTSPWVPYCM